MHVNQPKKNLLTLFTPGEWINTANIDADVFINSTHIVETWHPDVSRWRKAVYVCKEQRDSRYMMARLTIDGCQVDYQCFDFLPRHHNVIRFRKGVAMIMDNFQTVCSYVQFKNDDEWKYDIMLSMLTTLKFAQSMKCNSHLIVSSNSETF